MTPAQILRRECPARPAGARASANQTSRREKRATHRRRDSVWNLFCRERGRAHLNLLAALTLLGDLAMLRLLPRRVKVAEQIEELERAPEPASQLRRVLHRRSVGSTNHRAE
eukprot:5167637-Prymnesium_polylepis.1